jgi:tetratricopeptide (TPR) repeat protein
MRISAWIGVLSVSVLLSLSAALPAVAQEKQKFRPRDIPRLMEEADKFIAANDLPKAEAYLKTIVEIDPRQAQAAFKLGRVQEAQENWDAMMTSYQLALSGIEGAEKAEAHAGLATGHLRAERYPDAAEQARNALALDASLARAHVVLAAALVELGEPGAVEAAEAAAAAAPDDPVAHAAHGEALLKAGRAADAEPALRRALELDASRAETHAQLATVLDAKGDHEGVVTAVTEALSRDPGRRELFVLRGRALLALGKDAEALDDLHAAAAVGNADAALHLSIAKIHHAQGRYPIAAQHYRSAVELDPQVGEAHRGLADVLVLSHDLQAAREPAERAAGMLPSDARAQYLLGRVHEHAQEYDQALAAYAKAVSLDASLAEAHHAQGRILREHKKDVAAGLASLEQAVALAPDDPAILTDLGAALFEAKQLDRTIETLQKVVATPDYRNPMGYGVLGLALKDKGDYAGSLPLLEKAIELEPKWWMPHWGAAWSHFGLIKKGCPCGAEDEERVKKMQAHLDQVTSLGGSDPALAERVKALASGQKIR